MASSSPANRDGVNPLRPYYIPPKIGQQTLDSSSFPSPRPQNATGPASSAPQASRYASRARDMFSDMDYNDFLDDHSPSTLQSAKALVDDLVWKYTSVLMAQPFEVAKIILQIRQQDDVGGLHVSPLVDSLRPSLTSPRASIYDYHHSESDDDEDDENAYFSSNVPYATPTPSARSRNHRFDSPLESPTTPASATGSASNKSSPPHQLSLRRPDSLFDVISQLWSKEGAWGVWKGTNATFLYTVLQSLLENWSRSLLSALLNVPDLGVKDDVDKLVDIASPYPWASLCVAAAAAVATGLILAPLDLVRTRLIATPTSRGPRRTLATLRRLPSYLCPPSLVTPTILTSLIHPILTLSTPLVLRSQFLIDRELSPATFSAAKFCTSCASLFAKLPLETVLRRGQMAVLAEPGYARALDRQGRLDTVVTPGRYQGVTGTMYSIVTEEGSHAVSGSAPAKSPPRGRKGKSKVAETVYRRGQGLEGLWRGWKVSWWGLMGLWTAGIAGGGGEGEF